MCHRPRGVIVYKFAVAFCFGHNKTVAVALPLFPLRTLIGHDLTSLKRFRSELFMTNLWEFRLEISEIHLHGKAEHATEPSVDVPAARINPPFFRVKLLHLPSDSWRRWTSSPGSTWSGSRSRVLPRSRCSSRLREPWRRTMVRTWCPPKHHNSNADLFLKKRKAIISDSSSCSSSRRHHPVIRHLFGPKHLSVHARPRRQDLHGNCPGLDPGQRSPGPPRPLHPCRRLTVLHLVFL